MFVLEKQAARRRGDVIDHRLVARHANVGERGTLLQQREEARVECRQHVALVVLLVTRVATSGYKRIDPCSQDLAQQRNAFAAVLGRTAKSGGN